jgi:undecaprenyl-diphosphatase
MVVPLIFGKIAKDLLEIIKGESVIESVSTTPLIVGFLAAFIVGLLACTWMISLVRNAKLHYFSYYCFAVGVVAIIAGVMNL